MFDDRRGSFLRINKYVDKQITKAGKGHTWIE
jgi:hypothetical protein